ncbi:MAG: tRNA (adenine-N1)-methyltransferase [Dehalococcoidia bacterium]
METQRGPVRAGERVMLTDAKGRRYNLLLDGGRTFNTHLGVIPHAAIIGCEEGARLRTADGAEFFLMRPATADFVVKMGRPTNILYPKDIGMITAFGGVVAGSRVVEAGTGSGSGTIALARAVGSTGELVSYELRPEYMPSARRNIEGMFAGAVPPWVKLKEGDIAEAIEEQGMDAVVLDLPEPWTAIATAARALRPGGFFVAFVPTTVQLQQTVQSLDRSGRFVLTQALECLVRGWEANERSVRPSHRMVGHTGFLVFSRSCGPGLPAEPSGGD